MIEPFFLVLFSFSLLFAKDIVGTGYGKSEEEALRNSRTDCTNSIYITVSSITYTSNSDDGKNNTSSELKSSNLEYTSFVLLGSEESSELQSDGTYKATTIIPSTAVSLYEAQLDNLYSSVVALNKALETSKTKDNYIRLISALKDYERYQTVVLTLSPNSQKGQRSHGVSRNAIEGEYQSMLIKEKNENEVTLSSLSTQAELGILTLEGQKKLEETEEKIKQNQIEQQELAKQSENERKLKMEKMQQNMYASMVQISDNFNSLTIEKEEDVSTYIGSLISRIEGNRDAFKSVKSQLNGQINSVNRQYNSEVNKKMAEIQNRPYESFELYLGKPTDEVKKAREIEKEAQKEVIKKDYIELGTASYELYYPKLKAINDESLSLIRKLTSTSYIIDSDSQYISAYIDNYSEGGFFTGVAKVTIGNNTFPLYFKIPYAQWTGERIPQASDYTKYSAFRKNIKDWLELFKEMPEIFTLKLYFDIETDGSPEYTVSVNQYKIIRNDTHATICTEIINQKEMISYSGLSFNDFSIPSSELINKEKVESDYAKAIKNSSSFILSNSIPLTDGDQRIETETVQVAKKDIPLTEEEKRAIEEKEKEEEEKKRLKAIKKAEDKRMLDNLNILGCDISVLGLFSNEKILPGASINMFYIRNKQPSVRIGGDIYLGIIDGDDRGLFGDLNVGVGLPVFVSPYVGAMVSASVGIGFSKLEKETKEIKPEAQINTDFSFQANLDLFFKMGSIFFRAGGLCNYRAPLINEKKFPVFSYGASIGFVIGHTKLGSNK